MAAFTTTASHLTQVSDVTWLGATLRTQPSLSPLGVDAWTFRARRRANERSR
jgi:hypothetical protein